MHVKQIVNLFTLMELFSREKQPLAVSDMVAEFSWPRSSTFNLVTTLVDEGYLYQPEPRGGYYPTSKWMELAKAFDESQPLPVSVHVLLEDLKQQTGETLFLAAAEGTSAVFLDVAESSADIRLIANVGQRLPIHVTAAGRAILAQYSTAERASVLKRIKFQAYETDRFMSVASVEEEIQKGVAAGWHINRANYAPGVAGIAVPFAFRGRRNAIALGAPVARIDDRVEAIGALLRDTVSRFLAEHDV